MTQRRISRREFLAGLGVTGAVVAAGGYGMTTWTGHDSPSAKSVAGSRPSTTSGGAAPPRTLILLEPAGGNDALNMGVPTGAAYRPLRPTLAVTEPRAPERTVGLSPKLTTRGAQYKAGRLAIIEGVGVPNPNLSHFASLQRWWTADPDFHETTGWIGRYLDRAVGLGDPIAGIAIGPGPSPVGRGRWSWPAGGSPSAAAVRPRARRRG